VLSKVLLPLKMRASSIYIILIPYNLTKRPKIIPPITVKIGLTLNTAVSKITIIATKAVCKSVIEVLNNFRIATVINPIAIGLIAKSPCRYS